MPFAASRAIFSLRMTEKPAPQQFSQKLSNTFLPTLANLKLVYYHVHSMSKMYSVVS